MATTDREALNRAYEQGWHESADWSKRQDLHDDTGSQAYIVARDERLAALAAPPVEQQAAVAKPLTDEDAGLLEQAATMLELQSIDLRDRGHDSEAAGAECSADAVRRLAVMLLRAEKANAQWWLARMDQHGNPTLVDGAHAARSGADQAMFLINAMNLAVPGARYAVARVDLSEPKPDARGVNHEAVAIINAAQPAPQAGAAEALAKVKADMASGCCNKTVSVRCFGCPHAARPTEQPSQDAERLWDAFIAEVERTLGFKVVNLMGSVEKLRAMYLDAARAAQAQGESKGGGNG